MVDINNSQNFDPETRREVIAENRQPGSIFGGILEVAAIEKRELDDPIAFYHDTFGNRPLWRFVLTHPDLDHMRGLKKLFEHVDVWNFWDTANAKPAPSFRSVVDREDWDFYQSLRREGRAKYYTRDDAKFAFNLNEDGSWGGDDLHILSPSTDLVGECNRRGCSNDISLTLLVRHAGVNILLPGDAEDLAWNAMVAHYGPNLKSDVLKASHHGRESGFHLDALRNIAPDWVVLSVGRKPSTDAQRKYSHHCGIRALSTRRHGTLRLEVGDHGQMHWFADRNHDE